MSVFGKWTCGTDLEGCACRTCHLRIRITVAPQGDLDGVELSTFAVGMTYEVSASLATYLVTTGCAVVADPSDPIVVLPLNDIRFANFIDRARDVAAESRKLMPPPAPPTKGLHKK